MGSSVPVGTDTINAVGALGAAMEASRQALAPLSQEAVALAHRLSRDATARAAIPSLAMRHATAVEAMEEALGRIWPRSSPSRPRNPIEAERACRHLEILIEDGRSALALRLSALAESDRDRLVSEAGHVLDTEARVRQMGLSLTDGGDPDTRAAHALDRLFEEASVKDLDEAERVLGELRALRLAVDACHAEAFGMCSSLGFADATLAQACSLAQAMSRFAHPWTSLMDGTADLAAMAGALRIRRDALAKLEESTATLTAGHGTAWASEEANKLAAASVILSSANDDRAVSARAYADGLGISGDDADRARILRTMARATQARRNLPELPPRHDELPSRDALSDADGCQRAIAFLTDVADWTAFMDRSAVLGRALSMLRAMSSQERHRVLSSAPAVASSLATLLAGSGRAILGELPGKLSARLSLIEGAVQVAREASDPAVARRAARALRERRLALSRIAAAPGYGETGAESPSELVAAWGWSLELTAALPPGLDPASAFVRSMVLPAAKAAVASASDARDAEDEGERSTPGGIPDLVEAAAASVRIAVVELARDEVGRAGAWSDVAWLEEEGIEPGLWREALEGRAASPETPAAEEPEETEPMLIVPRQPGRTLRPAFDFEDAGLWTSAGLTLGLAKAA